jgi:hypothetical protein
MRSRPDRALQRIGARAARHDRDGSMLTLCELVVVRVVRAPVLVIRNPIAIAVMIHAIMVMISMICGTPSVRTLNGDSDAAG